MGRGWREAVEEGSKASAPGVCRALRFWEMVSSTAERETRRKSRVLGYERELGGRD